MNILCLLGLHEWKYFDDESYPKHRRICVMCQKLQQYEWDFQEHSWRDLND